MYMYLYIHLPIHIYVYEYFSLMQTGLCETARIGACHPPRPHSYVTCRYVCGVL